ncbi:hypothetical protein [Tropicimonas sediminicola]|uniref:Uncharacterized protein n=1 Tax=Tropicimonas sediminicola TaxID=1031541 RepID=A0A239CPA4_9RHOB|nr:hypothetical protein [Tropicimonas sediminicola]SNS22086.1 hypothetical protein SAMN05421757_101407 [Tropicimonas sediminicola]
MAGKNPYMSWWLSEANKAASASRGLFAAEMSRQQKAMTDAWTEQAVEMWMAFWFPWMPRGGKRRGGR